MKPLSFMIIAGEASGDLLAAELVAALRDELAKIQARYTPEPQAIETSLTPRFFGAGGPKMRAAGVDTAFDLTEHAAIGLDAARKYSQLWRYLRQLARLAQVGNPTAKFLLNHGVGNTTRGNRWQRSQTAGHIG